MINLGQWSASFSHRFSFQIELVGAVHESVEDGIGQGRLTACWVTPSRRAAAVSDPWRAAASKTTRLWTEPTIPHSSSMSDTSPRVRREKTISDCGYHNFDDSIASRNGTGGKRGGKGAAQHDSLTSDGRSDAPTNPTGLETQIRIVDNQRRTNYGPSPATARWEPRKARRENPGHPRARTLRARDEQAHLPAQGRPWPDANSRTRADRRGSGRRAGPARAVARPM